MPLVTGVASQDLAWPQAKRQPDGGRIKHMGWLLAQVDSERALLGP